MPVRGCTCVGQKLGCDDGDPCTADSCAASAGCAHTAKADGDVCTADGCTETGCVCQAGACVLAAKWGPRWQARWRADAELLWQQHRSDGILAVDPDDAPGEELEGGGYGRQLG